MRRTITAARDYVVTASGAMSRDTTQVPNVLLAVCTTRGSVPSAPNFGRRPRSGKVSQIGRRVEEKALRDAVAHLVDAGAIWDLDVVVTIRAGRFDSTITFRDGSGPQTVNV